MYEVGSYKNTTFLILHVFCLKYNPQIIMLEFPLSNDKALPPILLTFLLLFGQKSFSVWDINILRNVTIIGKQ